MTRTLECSTKDMHKVSIHAHVERLHCEEQRMLSARVTSRQNAESHFICEICYVNGGQKFQSTALLFAV